MQLINPSFEIWNPFEEYLDFGTYCQCIMQHIEKAGRVAYKTGEKIGKDTYKKFIKSLMSQEPKHRSVIEHGTISVLFITSRGVTHELVRHRLASYTQSSTRYIDPTLKFDGHIPYIIQSAQRGKVIPGYYNYEGIRTISNEDDREWADTLLFLESRYKSLRARGWQPQRARGILPNDLWTEIVSTFNLSEWYHVFYMRTHEKAHPDMRELMIPLKAKFAEYMPEIFGDN